MNEGDGDRSFAHGRRNPFDAAATHVSHGENVRQTGLKQVRPAGQGPVRSVQVLWRQNGASLNEALVVERDAAIEPAGVGSGASHDENVANLVFLGLPGLPISPTNGFEVIVSFEGDDLGAWPEYYRRSLFDPPNQIARHGVSQTGRSDEKVYALCGCRQIHGRLPRGIPAPDHNHFLSTA